VIEAKQIPGWRVIVEYVMKEKGLRREDLIAPLGVTTESAVGNYFSGSRNLDLKQAVALARFLGLTLDEMMSNNLTDYDGSDSALLSNNEKEILAIFSNLSFSKKKIAINIVKALGN
jgi:predicted transcriptional regulator